MHQHRLSISSGGGFTLTELLVSITIVSVLLALLFSALSSSTNQAHLTGCQANLRAIAIGLSTFAADHQNQLPSSVAPGIPLLTWDRALVEGGYVPGPEVFQCPGDDNPRQVSLAGDPAVPRSYSINSNVFGDESPSGWYPPSDPDRAADGYLNRATLPLGKIIMVWDRPSEANWYRQYASMAFSNIASNIDPNLNHQTGANYLFADGHIEYLDWRDLGFTGFTNEYFYAKP